ENPESMRVLTKLKGENFCPQILDSNLFQIKMKIKKIRRLDRKRIFLSVKMNVGLSRFYY
ncbi:hypothetical protein, partial [Lederbergia ruris]|uniref:hypothetical protein n=1 Tax=Lederbergia ruris TaxID=217495 RepID=UPI0039A33A53